MKAELIALAVLVSPGCATVYHAERVDPDSGARTTIDVKSYREFKGGIAIDYNRDTGAFELEAGEVNRGVSPLEDVAAAILLQQAQGGKQ